MLKLLTALGVFAGVMGLTAIFALLMGSLFSAAAHSQWWKKWSLSEEDRAGLQCSGSPYGAQGSQREATLRRRGSDESGDGDGGGGDGGGGGD
jgi:hypothetical protein